jgi:hypothetical protein
VGRFPLRSFSVEPKTVGRMLGATRTRDPIDAHVVLLARERDWPVITSDPDDLHAIDPGLTVQPI